MNCSKINGIPSTRKSINPGMITGQHCPLISKYPEAVRRLIYTTNAIEGFNRQLRKVTKSKTVFPSDDSLLKMLYLATMDITKNGPDTGRDWGQIHLPAGKSILKNV
ncbi:MAG: transposase [Coprococcus phoceensis]